MDTDDDDDDDDDDHDDDDDDDENDDDGDGDSVSNEQGVRRTRRKRRVVASVAVESLPPAGTRILFDDEEGTIKATVVGHDAGGTKCRVMCVMHSSVDCTR